MFKLLYDKCSEVTALTKVYYMVTIKCTGCSIGLLQDKKCVLHVAALHDADQISEFVLAKGDFPIDLEDKVIFIATNSKLLHISLSMEKLHSI